MATIAVFFLPTWSNRYPPTNKPVKAPGKYMDESSVFCACRDPTLQYKSNSTENEVWSRIHIMSDGPRINCSLPSIVSVRSQGNSCSILGLALVKFSHFSDLHNQVSFCFGSTPELLNSNNH